MTKVSHHRIALPERPVIDPAHYLGPPRAMDGSPRPPKPSNGTESAFLAIGPGSESWLIEAAASGAARIRTEWPPLSNSRL
ncbi:hypothetical protein [Streptomyces luteogriseus]|uniref:hypothetical protein n=1 Tax=Streptomyces luteogriseus TaxID=68233 RepID=UPI0037A60124